VRGHALYFCKRREAKLVALENSAFSEGKRKERATFGYRVTVKQNVIWYPLYILLFDIHDNVYH
jgi:hypothetical protein